MSAESHTLHTQLIPQSGQDGEFIVCWRIGGRVGRIRVEFRADRSLSDLGTAAELAAVQFLLSDKEVMGSNRTGKGIILDVSRGAIRKLKHGTSNKKDLAPYAAFLVTRYHEATITVAKKATWIPGEIDQVEHDELVVEGPRFESVDTPRMGRITVTKHAIEQYEERFSEGDLTRTWASLVKRLQNAELSPVALPPKVEKHKARLYGDRTARAWRHPDGTLHFVVAENEDGSRSLITVFYRIDTKIDRQAANR